MKSASFIYTKELTNCYNYMFILPLIQFTELKITEIFTKNLMIIVFFILFHYFVFLYVLFIRKP